MGCDEDREDGVVEDHFDRGCGAPLLAPGVFAEPPARRYLAVRHSGGLADESLEPFEMQSHRSLAYIGAVRDVRDAVAARPCGKQGEVSAGQPWQVVAA